MRRKAISSSSVSARALAKVDYCVEDGVIIIATKDSLPVRMKTRIYDITDLVSAPANYFTMPRLGPSGYGGLSPYGGYNGMGYGRGFGYGGVNYGGPFITGGYRTNVGRIRTGTNLNVSPFIMGSSGYSRGQEFANLLDTLYGSSRQPYRDNTRRRRK